MLLLKVGAFFHSTAGGHVNLPLFLAVDIGKTSETELKVMSTSDL
jgi:hypothetical protein